MAASGKRFGPLLTRRALLAGTAAAACGRRKGTGFPGHVFVANEAGRSVAAVDLTAFAVSRQIGLPAAPTAVEVLPPRPAVYVLAAGAGAVYEIDPAAMRLKRAGRLGEAAIAMRPAPDRGSFWVLEGAALVRVELERLRPARRIRLPGAPSDFDISSEGLAAVALPQSGQVAIADLHQGRIERMIDAGPQPLLVRFRSDGRHVLIGSRAQRSVIIADVKSGKVLVRLPLAIEPARFCSSADGGQLFVSGPGMDAVAIIFPYRTEVGETILAGESPGAMTVMRTPPYLFVANPTSSRVTILDIDTRKLVGVVAVGQEPAHILITPDNQYALVLNHGSGDVAVIRTASLAARRSKIAPLFTMIPVGPRPVSAAVLGV
jgi:DNA-binding beta-propeller fold protein YncE